MGVAFVHADDLIDTDDIGDPTVRYDHASTDSDLVDVDTDDGALTPSDGTPATYAGHLR